MEREITHDEIARAIREAAAKAQAESKSNRVDYSKGLTSKEIAAALGWSTAKVLDLARQGILESAGRQPRPNIIGEWNRSPVFRLVQEERNK